MLQDEKETLDQVNAKIMERLRQEVGSEGGVYHVYLPDGRLQRVQYTSAPVQQEQPQKNNQVLQSYLCVHQIMSDFLSRQ